MFHEKPNIVLSKTMLFYMCGMKELLDKRYFIVIAKHAAKDIYRPF